MRSVVGVAGSIALAACLTDTLAPARGPVARFDASRPDIELTVGDAISFTAHVYDSVGNVLLTTVDVRSTDTTIATIVRRTILLRDPLPATFVTVEAVGYGTTSLVASLDDVEDTIASVTAYPAAMEITNVQPVYIGSSHQLGVRFFAPDSSELTPLAGAVPPTWNTSWWYIATVDQQGRVVCYETRDNTVRVTLPNGVTAAATFECLADSLGNG